VADSVRDTAAWLFGPGGEQEAFEEYRTYAERPAGLPPEKERVILAAHDAE
jgi:hypothetical protein